MPRSPSRTSDQDRNPTLPLGLYKRIAEGLERKPAYLLIFAISALFALSGVISSAAVVARGDFRFGVLAVVSLTVALGAAVFVVRLVESRNDLEPASPVAQSRSVTSGRAIGSFEVVVSELQREFLDGGVFASWRPPQDPLRDVSNDYLIRIAIQKLMHSASLIRPDVISTNLWVLHNALGPSGQYLRSEEREGHFSVGQLVEADPGGVRYRATILSFDPKLREAGQLPAAAKAVVEGHTVLVDVGTTRFDSRPELELGTRVIIGVPCPAASPGDRRPGDLMSLTIDLAGQLDEADRPQLLQRAHQLQRVLGDVVAFRHRSSSEPSR